MKSCTSASLNLPRRRLAIAILAGIAFVAATPAVAQDACGVAANYFQIDGQFFSSGAFVDWAQGASGQGVFDNGGNPVLLPALYDRDEHWAGNSVDPDQFDGSGNKNNDDISSGAAPWSWGSGSGPAKNDLTDVYAHSATKDGNLWLFLGAATRSNNGASHIDFEFNQQGFTTTGTTSGSIIGNGPDAGRTQDVDFIVSLDYTDGGNVPVVSFRKWHWTGGQFEFVLATPDPGNVFVCTNDTAIPAPPWGAISPGGTETDEFAAYQFVEIAVNLTGLGIDPRVFCTDVSTLLFKTRSAPSFTAELKDFALYQFSILAPPACTIGAERSAVCAGESGELCAPEPPAGADYSYAWDGPGGPYPDARCITASQAGAYSLTVTDNRTGCSSETCTFNFTVDPLPVCSITPDRTVVCTGETANFCGPQAPAGQVYSYEWTGPGGSYPDVRCLAVGEAGTYHLTVLDLTTGCSSSGCEAALTVHPLPLSSITGPNLLCEGTSGQLCGPEGNLSYAWSGPGGPYTNIRCIQVSLPGRYTLVLTDLATGCQSEPAVHDVLVAGNPGCEILGPATVCPGMEIELCGPEGNFNYTWDGPGGPYPSQRCIQVGQAGTYSLRVDDQNGCISECEHAVTLDENVTAGQIEDVFLCTGQEAEFCVTASGTGPLAYQWFKNGGAISGATGSCFSIPAITRDDAGHYTVTVTGKCNSVTRDADLVLADVSVAALRNLYLCQGQRAELCAVVSGKGPFTYVWTRDGAVLPDQTDSCLVLDAVTELDEGRYCVSVQGYCGEPVTRCSSLYMGDCVEYCGLTQGAWGNAGGKWNGMTRLELLDLLITDGNPLVVGVPGTRSLSFPEGTESCIIALLPGGGTPHTLPAGLGDAVIDPLTCDVDNQFRIGKGRLRNNLLAQAITLSLNVRLDPNLPNLPLCQLVIMIPILPGPDGIRGTADDIPDNDHPRIVELSPAIFTALDYLGLPHTAGGALSLANLALADELSGQAYVQLGDIVEAVGSVNNLVDECALTIHCETPAQPQEVKIIDDRHLAQPVGAGTAVSSREFGLRVLTPNPLRAAGRLSFSVNLPERSRVEAAVYSLGGRIVSKIEAQELEGGDHTLDVDLTAGGQLASGIYFLRLVAQGEESGRRLSESRKLVLLQ